MEYQKLWSGLSQNSGFLNPNGHGHWHQALGPKLVLKHGPTTVAGGPTNPAQGKPLQSRSNLGPGVNLIPLL